MLAISSAILGLRPLYVAADAPVLADEDRIDSANHVFFAVPGPARKSTRVFRREKSGASVQEWQMPTWSVMGYLSDDGDYLVTVYPGVNILALDYRPDDVMVSIRRRGALVRELRLKELIRDFRSLGPRSESGFSWGEYEGFIGPHQFAVTTVERRRYVFDVETGRELASNPPSPPGSAARTRRRH